MTIGDHSTIALCGFALVACGPSAMSADAGTDGFSGDVAASSGFVVRVMTPDGDPIAGATVALDGPARSEELTDADGLAAFAVEWPTGGVDVIAWASPYGVRAWVDLDRDDYEALATDGALPLYLRAEPAPRITVSGNLSNVTAVDGYVVVSNDLTYETSDDPTSYSLSIPRSTPFQLLAIEVDYTGDSVSYDQPILALVRPPMNPGSDMNLVLDIDLSANRVPPVALAGSFPIPTDPWFDTAYPYALVTAVDTIASYGITTSAHPRADGSRIDYTSGYALPTPTTPCTTTFAMHNSFEGRTTWAYVSGAASGDQSFTFLTPPVLDPPAGGGFQRVFDEVSSALTPGAILTFRITRAGRIVGEVSGPPGAGRVRMPALPSGAGAAGLFVGEMGGYAHLCVLDPADASRRACTLEALSAPVPVDP